MKTASKQVANLRASKARSDAEWSAKCKALRSELAAMAAARREDIADAEARGRKFATAAILNRLLRNGSAGEQILLGQMLLNGRPHDALDPLEADICERAMARNVKFLASLGFNIENIMQVAAEVVEATTK
jgi:hypothetical protein